MTKKFETVPMVVLWEGERVDELPREKLIEIISELGRDLETERDLRRKESVSHVRQLAEIASELHRRRRQSLVDQLLFG